MRHGQPITEYPLRDRIQTGITLGRRVAGLVPELEVREAANSGHYNSTEFAALQFEERANVVAHYRLHHLIESHTQSAAEQASKQKAAAQRGRRR